MAIQKFYIVQMFLQRMRGLTVEMSLLCKVTH